MTCHNCQKEARKHGKDRKGNQRYRCESCSKTFQEPREKPLEGMYLPLDKAENVLQLLLEGCSIRSTERITDVNRNTILSLLEVVGKRCESLLDSRIRNVRVKDVQCDEIWNFVYCKEKTKNRLGLTGERIGDAYCFTAIERHSKLVLAWHLGRRTTPDTEIFTEKLYHATSQDHFQITTDGFAGYTNSVVYSLGTRVDFAQLIKVYAAPKEDDHRYSPAEVVEAVPVIRHGNPDPDRICTSHVERGNLTLRMQMRRFTRLTNGFSKKWANLKSMLAIFFAWYNFCRIHSTIRVTPAMEAKITDHVWSIGELLAA